MVLRKIVQIDEAKCNGCGNCVPNCAEGALQIINGKAKIVKEEYCDGLGACLGHCPQGAITIVERDVASFTPKTENAHSVLEVATEDEFTQPQWPVKLNLVPAEAPSYEGASLLVVADCFPAAHPKLHNTVRREGRLLIGCPKFDDARAYAQKLTEILKRNKIAGVTIVHMEVPCCAGLKWAVDRAVQACGKQVNVKRYIITIGGEMHKL